MSIKNSIKILLAFVLARFLLIYVYQPTKGYIEFFDVGQGDSIFISTHAGKTILVDTGPDNSLDARLNEKFYLRECFLDMVVITHPHLDHYGGLGRLIKKCRINTLIINSVPPELSEVTLSANIGRVRQLYLGDIITTDGMRFCVFCRP